MSKAKPPLEQLKIRPWLAGLAAGLFPLIHYYCTNLYQLDSWLQLGFCGAVFLIFPLIVSVLIFKLSDLTPFLEKHKKGLLTALNLAWFGLLVTFILAGVKLKLMLLTGVGLSVLGFILAKQLKKIVVFQLILASISLVGFIPKIHDYFNYSTDWMAQPDNIETVQFKHRPNIYMIQMDGYANSQELEKSPYRFDNSRMNQFLENLGFKDYRGFRSNYYSTLSSNASMFAMKHHYYLEPTDVSAELPHARKFIVSNNPVLKILKANDYETNLIVESPYFLLNRKELAFDHSNFRSSEIPLLSRGFDIKKDVDKDLLGIMKNTSGKAQFYFIQKFLPSHITNKTSGKFSVESERDGYLERLEIANKWLSDLLPKILMADPDALIVIHADHGGFVGMRTTAESHQYQESPEIVSSIFSSVLKIKWPSHLAGNDFEIGSSVNLFRALFATLSEDTSYLQQQEINASYIKLDDDNHSGVYQYLDKDGQMELKTWMQQ